jgi:hypothetical protein
MSKPVVLAAAPSHSSSAMNLALPATMARGLSSSEVPGLSRQTGRPCGADRRYHDGRQRTLKPSPKGEGFDPPSMRQ